MSISAFALVSPTVLALVLAVPLWAQHGGGGHGGGGGGHFGGGGHSGGFSGGHSMGGFSGGHSMGSFHGGSGGYSGYENFGAHALSGARPETGYSPGYSPHFTPLPTTRNSYHGAYRGPLANNGFRNGFRNNGFGNNGFRNGFRNHGFRNGYGRFRNNYCWGYVCNGYGYPWWGYYDPFLWWGDDDSAYDQDYQNNLATADQMNQQSLEQQQMLDQEQSDGDQDAYADPNAADPDWNVRPPLRPADPGGANVGEAAMSPTVLVFRDQHQLEVENYAIVGGTLWSFSAHRTEKIPLSSLDLPATVKANDDRGVTFRLPSSGEGQ